MTLRVLDRLEADESRQEKLALVSGVLLFVASLVNLFLGAGTGHWLYLLPGGLFLLAAGLAIRNWRRSRSASGSP